MIEKKAIQSIDWKILVIDDEEDIRQVISIVLSDAGFEVSTASDGETGIQIAGEWSPQIVLTDIRMPKMDGIQVLEILKKECPDTEVIVLTAFGEMEQAVRALDLDASDYITKPVSDDVLFIALKRAQHRYLSRRQSRAYELENSAKKLQKGVSSGSTGTVARDLVQGAIDGALACDENETIISINHIMARMLGRSEQEIVNRMQLADIFSPDRKQKLEKVLYHKDYGWEKRISLHETSILDPSGNSIPVQMSVSLLTDNGNKLGMICFFRDLRKQMILCDQWVEMLDQINIGAFTIDAGRHITAFNASVQAMTGLKESDVLGKDCREVFSNIHCHARCPFHVESEQGDDELCVEIRDQEDAKHLITRLSTPLYGPGNRVTGCVTILQDHAALADLINRVNTKERSLKTVLDNLDIGIFTVNRGGYTTFFNTAAELISGYNRRQVLGRPCSVIFGEANTTEPERLRESMTLGESRVNNEAEIVTPQGEIVPVRANYIPLHSDQGKIIGCIATLQDLTLSHQYKQVVNNRYTFHSMIGKDPLMQKIFKTVEVVAKTDATILIEGDTGTGKDLLAKIVHSASKRADKPLVKVNCAALPENLLESELFGYVKGAFTGADRDKPGRFQEADQGTIFLDEIGDLPLSLQAKFLRVLEDKEFYPLGSRKTRKVDVRIISATNQGLENQVKARRFRQDLFYRLNVMHLELPPLNQRRDDIPLIIRHILRKLCSARAIPSHEISKTAMHMLLNYDYPGNVRELQNILEHALIVCQENIIEPDHLPLSLQNRFQRTSDEKAGETVPRSRDLNSGDREAILKMLRRYGWHKTKTAKALGMDRTTLWRKMKALGIQPR
ncbi:sigma-54-dependent Fis family transcriptional regulator [Desulfospira joergensenii]|uniref:sigma-54-dependent Fis family transcriptional regulator n=1 Tax=Desulfospira joergensenii TaxID=53329 RepID=UPI00040C7ECA|nr:sigma-54-dependent Fis family transcriptional regulator [Desulfospira joergensenii]